MNLGFGATLQGVYMLNTAAGGGRREGDEARNDKRS